MGDTVGKVAVIGTNDTISFKDYHSEYKELCDIVASSDGEHTMIEHFGDINVPKISGMTVSSQNGIMFCNEEFLCVEDENFNTLNAIASLLSGQAIYGNVALVIDDGNGGDFGFNEQEVTLMKNSIEQFCKEHKEELADLHKQYDNHKPEPYFAFTSFEVEDGEIKVGGDEGGNKSGDDDFGID